LEVTGIIYNRSVDKSPDNMHYGKRLEKFPLKIESRPVIEGGFLF
jgi:hypothetical protein